MMLYGFWLVFEGTFRFLHALVFWLVKLTVALILLAVVARACVGG